MADPLRTLVAVVAIVLGGASAQAAASPAAIMAICQNAAIHAADRNGVPRDVLVAITQVETGTRREGVYGAWPWTVNVAGKGAWFDSRAAALLHAQQALTRGQPSFDVGCFQLNYRWHGQHFASIDEMFEPGPSGDYAARFLKSLHAETGDWIKAAGLYHSRTEKHARRYRGLVARAVQRMGGEVPQPATELASTDHALKPNGTASRPAPVWPLANIARASTGSTSRTARSGGLGLQMLRRSTGSLVGPVSRGG